MRSFFIILLATFFFVPLLSLPSRAQDTGQPAKAQGNPPSLAARMTVLPLLNLYRNHLSAFTTTRCPSWPNCSHYSLQAVNEHGALVGVCMTVDRLIHEAGQIEQGQKVFIPGRGYLIRDPIENNDFWWKEPTKKELPDIPQMSAR